MFAGSSVVFLYHASFALDRTQSGDVTVATWGGSTADNMGSIEEDENDSGAGQEADDGETADRI